MPIKLQVLLWMTEIHPSFQTKLNKIHYFISLYEHKERHTHKGIRANGREKLMTEN